jgi:hypothetical protein
VRFKKNKMLCDKCLEQKEMYLIAKKIITMILCGIALMDVVRSSRSDLGRFFLIQN